MARTSFRVRLPMPPGLAAEPPAVRLQYWRWVADIAVAVKDDELSRGLDKDGRPLKPIAPRTRRYRRSAMTPTGKGDPKAPPLMPARELSRTRSLLAGRGLPTHAEVYWRFDPFTGDTWGRVLDYQAKRGRDVLGLSPKGLERVRVKSWDAYRRYKAGKHVEPPRRPAPAPAIPRIGTYSTQYATFGIGAKSAAKFDRGEWTGGMTFPEWRRFLTQPNPTPVPIPGRPKGFFNRLLGFIWGA